MVRRVLLALVIGALVPGVAEAAPPYVERRQTLRPVEFAFDVALGVGRYDFGGPVPVEGVGPGANLELAVGVARKIELGFRQGLRFGDEGKIAAADEYGRLYDWKTFETGGGSFSNPEARIRGQIVDVELLEVSLEGRIILPFAGGTAFGTLMGVPLAFHLGSIVRLDTGGFVRFVFRDGTPNAIVLPLDAWFQLGHRFWLGPRAGFVLSNPGGQTAIPLGFGLGYQFTSFGDFKAGFLFRDVEDAQGSASWGIGAGVQLRIE